MKNHEILDHWWEYYKIIWWGIFPPDMKKLMNDREITKKEIIGNLYKDQINLLANNTNFPERQKEFIESIDSIYLQEEERKKTIELKAHSLIGQTSIAITFLLAAISLTTVQYQNFSLITKLVIWFSFVTIIINFVTAGLHARNAVILKEGYATTSYSDFLDVDFSLTNYTLDKIYSVEHNSYLNEVKATYLKFSHWFFKCSFIITIFVSVLLPPFLMLTANTNPDASKETKVYIYKYNNVDSSLFQYKTHAPLGKSPDSSKIK